MQSRGLGVKRGNNKQFPQACQSLRAHDLYLGSLLFLTKQAPSPRFRFNMFMNYDIKTGKLIIPDDIERILQKLDIYLTGRTENTKIEILESESIEDATKGM